jgi:hypothetical protein
MLQIALHDHVKIGRPHNGGTGYCSFKEVIA